jgi:NAD(P)-dependent dehydrogenase (short-subunit alcohol dehydrogenase family)
MTCVADVTDADAVAAAIGRITARFGRLDAVVHTAQVMAYGRIEDVPKPVFERVVDVSLQGTANLARSVLPLFRAQGHGTLVIVNSSLGEIATPGMGAYVAAKWGQLGLARVLQLEVRDAPGVDVCVVSPGATDTPIYRQAANYSGRRVGPPPPVATPDRVAAAVVDCLTRPRRHVEVGVTNGLSVLGFRCLPGLYDRLVGPLMQWFVFGALLPGPSSGNVDAPVPDRESERGGWSRSGRRRPEDRREGSDQ